MSLRVAGVCGQFFVVLAPLEALVSQLVRRQRARALGERSCDHDALVCVPLIVFLQELGVQVDVERAQLRNLLCVRKLRLG